jgi:hypothetical protein
MKRHLILALLPALWSCRDLLDANDFDVAPAPPAGEQGEAPFYDEECLSCAANKCADESAACDADVNCRTQLACSVPCSTPDCLVACWLPYGSHPTPIHTVDDCLFNECAEECGRGTSFECTGNWGWTRLYPGGQHPPDATVAFSEGFRHILGAGPMPDLRVRTSGVEATTGADGRVVMTVPADLTGHTASLLVDDPTGLARTLPTVVHRGGPRRGGFEYQGWDLLSVDEINLTLGLGEAGEYDPERVYFAMQLWDCQRDSPPGLSVTIDSADEETVIAYLDGGFPGSDLEATTRDGVVLVAHAPPGVARITATHVASGKITHSFSTVLTAGEGQALRLWPLTTKQAN